VGDPSIDAHVGLVRTAVAARTDLRGRDLPHKHHERSFQERSPLPPALRARIRLTGAWRYASLAALIEALPMLRDLLLHTHDWSDDMVEELTGAIRRPRRDDATAVHQILGEMT
jgi:hypothetical protein